MAIHIHHDLIHSTMTTITVHMITALIISTITVRMITGWNTIGVLLDGQRLSLETLNVLELHHRSITETVIVTMTVFPNTININIHHDQSITDRKLGMFRTSRRCEVEKIR
jgi:hypothetical protein